MSDPFCAYRALCVQGRGWHRRDCRRDQLEVRVLRSGWPPLSTWGHRGRRSLVASRRTVLPRRRGTTRRARRRGRSRDDLPVGASVVHAGAHRCCSTVPPCHGRSVVRGRGAPPRVLGPGRRTSTQLSRRCHSPATRFVGRRAVQADGDDHGLSAGGAAALSGATSTRGTNLGVRAA
jgi:hypothetical protein